MRFLQSLPRTLLASVLLLVGRSGADFTATTSFGNVTNGQPLLLAWDSIDPTNYPLYVTVQLIDRDSDGHSATGYKANITSEIPPMRQWSCLRASGTPMIPTWKRQS